MWGFSYVIINIMERYINYVPTKLSPVNFVDGRRDNFVEQAIETKRQFAEHADFAHLVSHMYTAIHDEIKHSDSNGVLKSTVNYQIAKADLLRRICTSLDPSAVMEELASHEKWIVNVEKLLPNNLMTKFIEVCNGINELIVHLANDIKATPISLAPKLYKKHVTDFTSEALSLNFSKIE